MVKLKTNPWFLFHTSSLRIGPCEVAKNRPGGLNRQNSTSRASESDTNYFLFSHKINDLEISKGSPKSSIMLKINCKKDWIKNLSPQICKIFGTFWFWIFFFIFSQILLLKHNFYVKINVFNFCLWKDIQN